MNKQNLIDAISEVDKKLKANSTTMLDEERSEFASYLMGLKDALNIVSLNEITEDKLVDFFDGFLLPDEQGNRVTCTCKICLENLAHFTLKFMQGDKLE